MFLRTYLDGVDDPPQQFRKHPLQERIRHIPRAGPVSPGCAKVLVASERIAAALKGAGHDFAPDYAGADVVMVNTCGFLDSSRAESFAPNTEALAQNGQVIVTGRMGPATRAAIVKFLPAHNMPPTGKMKPSVPAPLPPCTRYRITEGVFGKDANM